jgi:RNA polymerase sigma factor (sigma-70 family)
LTPTHASLVRHRTPTSPGGPGAAELTDEELLRAVRAGGDWAYAELYRRHEREVRLFARTLVAPDDVDELISESFAKMLGALRRSRGPVDHPIRYLMVTTRTSAISLRQRHHRQHELRNHAGLRGAVVDEDPTGMDDDLRAAFGQLSIRRRKVLWWSVVDGLSPSEIGALMGVAPATVSALLYRAKRALRAAYLAEVGENRLQPGPVNRGGVPAGAPGEREARSEDRPQPTAR